MNKKIIWIATDNQSFGHGIGLKVKDLIVAFIEDFEWLHNPKSDKVTVLLVTPNIGKAFEEYVKENMVKIIISKMPNPPFYGSFGTFEIISHC